MTSLRQRMTEDMQVRNLSPNTERAPSPASSRLCRIMRPASAEGALGGAAGILGLRRALRTILFEVRPMEPSILFVVLLLIVAAVLGASVIPARRLWSLDPTTLFQQG